MQHLKGQARRFTGNYRAAVEEPIQPAGEGKEEKRGRRYCALSVRYQAEAARPSHRFGFIIDRNPKKE